MSESLVFHQNDDLCGIRGLGIAGLTATNGNKCRLLGIALSETVKNTSHNGNVMKIRTETHQNYTREWDAGEQRKRLLSAHPLSHGLSHAHFTVL